MGITSAVTIWSRKITMIRQQPEGHDTFAAGGFLLLRSKSEPGDTLYHSGFCELAQRQAVYLRKDKL